MTPTEHQRVLFEYRAPKPRKGLDHLADSLVGRYKRGPWLVARLRRAAAETVREREQLDRLTDAELNERLAVFREHRKRKPADVPNQLVSGLALLAVAAERELGLRAYEVQLMASAALVQGIFTEVDTGEGKTLAIGMAAAFQALSGLPCHVVTANDYLAGRDAKNLGAFYRRVGLSVSSVLGEDGDDQRREAYACGVTYSTAKEVAADYLRDRLKGGAMDKRATRLLSLVAGRTGHGEPVQRGLHYALIDEADHALIDEAVTPLIISRSLEAGEMEPVAKAAWATAKALEEGVHYRLNRAQKEVELLDAGVDLVREKLTLPRRGLWASERRRLHVVRQGLEAREFFLRDEQYVVDEGRVVIVDPSTGRPMPMRSWQQGLHQIIEAKEGLQISGGTETLARISFQGYFRKYHILSGASGTLKEVAGELWHTYHRPFAKVPRNRPCQRQYAGVFFCPDEAGQRRKLLHEIKSRHGRGQPLLIGSRSVDRSEKLASLLRAENLPGSDRVLNAIHHRNEANLVALAGRKQAITISTSMAGRGTDIRLENGVEILGGLHVISVDANESSRVDRQLFGRAARQGDPGSVIAIYRADDELLKRFVPDPLRDAWKRSLQCSWLGCLPHWLGRRLLGWAHFRANQLSARSRRGVMMMETEIDRSLGFTGVR